MLCQVRLSYIRFDQVRFDQVMLGQARLGQVRIDQVRLGLVRLGSVRLDQARLGQFRLGQVTLSQIRSGWDRLGPKILLRTFCLISRFRSGLFVCAILSADFLSLASSLPEPSNCQLQPQSFCKLLSHLFEWEIFGRYQKFNLILSHYNTFIIYMPYTV